MAVGIAIAGWRVFRPHSRAMTQWLFAFGIANLVLGAVEQQVILSMLSLSQARAAAGAADAAAFRVLAGAVGAARHWAHFVNLIAGGGAMLVLYALLCRFALVPRLLAAFGVGAFVLQLIAVTMPLFGATIVFPLLAPAGLAHLALVVWLLVKGFDERRGASAAQRA
jgi:hypothetical protein